MALLEVGLRGLEICISNIMAAAMLSSPYEGGSGMIMLDVYRSSSMKEECEWGPG